MRFQQPLSEHDLTSLLAQTFLRGLSYFQQTDSTNTQALELLRSQVSLETPHLVYAHVQTSGRGRGNNRWWSSPGSLTFSVIIDCDELGLTPEQQPQISLLTGIALLRMGQSAIPRGDFALKWPNDVYLTGRKLAGILAETPAQSTRQRSSRSPRHVVIGVGLNVNNQFASAPNDLQISGVSLSDVSGRAHNRIEILTSFLRRLEGLNRSLAQGERVLDQWTEFCLLTGKLVTIEAGRAEVRGWCRGIDATGALLLETDQGQKRFNGGVVKSWTR